MLPNFSGNSAIAGSTSTHGVALPKKPDSGRSESLDAGESDFARRRVPGLETR
jgi:hypothetical protein